MTLPTDIELLLGDKSHTTILETDLGAIEHNLRYFMSKLAPQTQLIAMVKASSYGAGDYQIAHLLEQQEGIYALSVAYVDEGATLRCEGITKRIIVLNADDESFDAMIENQLEPEIYSPRSLRLFIEAIERRDEHNYPIHIKIDSGMHRLGLEESMLEEIFTLLESAKERVRVDTIFSHLCCADVEGGEEYTRSQVALFEHLSQMIIERLGYAPLRHIANSAAIVSYPEAHYDIVRLGIGLYGYGTCSEYLHKASTLKSRIMQIKSYEAGTTIGYNRATRLERPSRIATIPIGYADGLSRNLGCGVWSVEVAEKRAPIVGRVCMDSAMVDITGIEGVEEGDEVVIFSSTEGHTAQDMADRLETIPYEVLTSISKRVKRVFVSNNKK